MVVQVRLFAMFRERLGTDTLELRLPAHATVADALAVVRAHSSLGSLTAESRVVMAVNREYAEGATVLAPGDELALIPPVSGGAEPTDACVHVLITDQPLDVDRVCATVANPGAGAIVLFQGVTRELPRLHYEAYIEMAHERLERIARQALSSHSLLAVALEHRVGDVALGEPSVLVAVSSAHREEAFAAAREIIDEVKRQAPIWKREDGHEGAGSWLAGTEIQT
jgi:molybdopterin synthase catalytic subunit